MSRKLQNFILLFLFFGFSSTGFSAVTSYSFVTSAGTFNQIFPAHTYGNSGTDDNIYTESLGFPFVFDGITYTSVNIHSNGFLFFSLPINAANYFPLSSGIDHNVISACGEDLLSQVGGEIGSGTSGSVGNRVFTLQFIHYRHWTSGGTEAGDRNFQIKLYEFDGTIEFVYGNFQTFNFYTAQIGLMGASTADVKNRQTTSNWSATVPGINPMSACALNPNVAPVFGLTFTFKPGSPIKLLGMVSPTSPGCSNTSSEIVSCRLKNNSAAPYNFSTSPIEVHCSSIATNPLVFPTINLNTGSIPGNATFDVIISPATYDMSIPGSYTFKTNLFSTINSGMSEDTTVLTVNSALSAGVASVSNDSICLGLNDSLVLTGAMGYIQWQHFDGTNWIDESASGCHSSVYIVTPTATSLYRAKVCDALFSNAVRIDIFSVAPPTTTDGTRCGPGNVLLSAAGSGALQWYPVDPLTPAIDIPIQNNSFESPAITTATNSLGQVNITPFPWNSFGSVSVYSPNLPGASSYNTLGISADGAQIVGTHDALFNAPGGSGFYQLLTQTFVAGHKYIFSFYAGGSYDVAGGNTIARISSLATGSSYNLASPFLAESIVPFPALAGNHWVEVATEYIATLADQGKQIVLMMGTNDTDGPQTYDFANLKEVVPINTGTSFSPNLSAGGLTQSYSVGSFVTINNLICHSSLVPINASSTISTPVSVSPLSDFVVCSGVSTTLIASSLDLDYTYSWSPTVGLNVSTGATVVATPLANTQYTISSTDAVSGCAELSYVNATVEPTPGTFSISTHRSAPCTGGPTTLAPAFNSPNVVQIGTGTLVNSPANFPAPISSVTQYAKNQMLYRASELIAAGFTPGSIDFVAFDISNVNACPQMSQFVLMMGLTGDTSLTGFESGLTQVTLPTWVIPVLGDNTFILSTPFSWDGVSNILVQTCINATSIHPSNGNPSFIQSATSYSSCLVLNQNSAPTCAVMNVSSSYHQRPNIRFGRNVNFNFSWSPGTELNDSTLSSVQASPSLSTLYTLTISNGSCVNSDTLTVLPNAVLPLPVVHFSSSTGSYLMCPGDSIEITHTPVCSTCSYNWIPSLNVSDSTSSHPWFKPLINTTYTLFVTDTMGCEGSNSQVLGLYAAPPNPTITRISDSLFCSPASAYQWYLNGSAIAGATQSSIAITSNGDYSIEIFMGTNTCGSSSVNYSVLNVYVSKTENKSNVSLYPNPFNETTVFHFTMENAGRVKIELIDVLGRSILIMQDGMVSSGDHDIIIRKADFNINESLVFLKMSTDTKNYTLKLVGIE